MSGFFLALPAARALRSARHFASIPNAASASWKAYFLFLASIHRDIYLVLAIV